MIRKFLLGIDLFGISVPINFSGKELSNSKLGGTCSVLFFCFIGWAIYNSTDALFNKKNPSIFRYESYTADPQQLLLSSETFPVGIQIQAPDGLLNKPYIDASIYKLQIVHKLFERIIDNNGTVQERWTITEIPTERCTPEHFGSLAPNFASLDLDSINCVAKGNKLYIQGVYESMVYQSLTISILECNNSTSEVICASQNTLDSYLEGGRFNLLYGNLAINLENFAVPTFRFKDSYKTTIGRNYPKMSTIELGKVEVTTDSGWFLEPDETSNFIKVEKITEGLHVGPGSQKALMTCSFEASKIENHHSRSYKRIQNVLAEVGGLANALIVIFSIVIKPYLKFKVQESLMNELFEVSLAPKLQKMRSKSFTFRNTKTMERKITRVDHNNISDDGSSSSSDKKTDKSDKSEGEREGSKISQLMREISASSAFLNQPKIKYKAQGDNKGNNFMNWTFRNQSNIPLEKSPKVNNKKDLRNISQLESSSGVDFLEKQNVTQSSPNMFQDKSISIAGPTFLDEPSTPNRYQTPNNKPTNHYSIEISKKGLSHQKSAGQKELTVEKTLVKKVSICDSGAKENQREGKPRPAVNGSVSERLASGSASIKRLNNLIKKKNDKTKKVRLNLWEYISSFVYQSDQLKRKLQVINKGIKSIHQRLDVINILKKLREMDKLKALMLDPEQLLLFNNMPRPELFAMNHDVRQRRASFSRESLRKLTFIPGPSPEVEIISSFEHIKARKFKTNIDERLIEIFEEIDF